MIQSTEWVLNAILHRYPASRREALSLFLSQSQRDRLQTMPEPKIEAQAEEPSLLDYLHWSWLVPFFKPKTGKEQKLFLSALPQGLREKLSIALAIKLSGKESLKTIGKDFLLQQIREFFLGETNEKLPLYFLPPSPLTPLLRMKKQDIIRLIDYIALYDLATEIQRIVDTKILKKIYAFLIKEEKEFLEQASRLKSSHSSVRLPLDAWDGTEKELRLLLHKRGLARLGVAISGQHPDFIWYFSHQLDRGRGATLAKLAEAPNIPSVSILPIRQIEEILRNFFS